MSFRLQPYTLMLAAVAVLLLPGSTVPQTFKPANLTGVVKDCSGGVVPGAVIILTNDGMNHIENREVPVYGADP
jgi:hypothetical protein